MNPILSIAGLFVLVFTVLIGRDVIEQLQLESKWKKRSEMYDRYFAASREFDRWRVARPFLWVGQSPYAQSLVWTMINSCDWLLKDDPTWGYPFVITSLYKLLEEQPPPYTPPDTKPGPNRALPFLISSAILLATPLAHFLIS